MRYAQIRKAVDELTTDGKPHAKSEILTKIFGEPCTSPVKVKS